MLWGDRIAPQVLVGGVLQQLPASEYFSFMNRRAVFLIFLQLVQSPNFRLDGGWHCPP